MENIDSVHSNVQSSRQEAFIVCVRRQRSSDQNDH